MMQLFRYSGDHPGEPWPDDLAEVAQATSPKIFFCYSSGNPVGDPTNVMDWTDYVYVPGLSTLSPGDTAVTYCRPGNHGSRGTTVGFVDGHAEWVPSDRYTEVLGTNWETLAQQ